MLRRDAVVVGAGISGLTLAGELGAHLSVTIVDRLPAIGGVLGYEHPLARELGSTIDARHVEVLLGTTALRWLDHRLLVAGPRGIEWVAADRLVFCGGTRPSTAAELAVGGDRPAGIFSATVAIHLMEAGVRLGPSVVLVGSSDWAARAEDHLRRTGSSIAAHLDGDAPSQRDAGEWAGWRLFEVHGAARVSHVIVARDRFRQRISCDAVILGSRLKPLRNVDGAIVDGVDVTFVQPAAATMTAQAVEAFARTAAAGLLATRGGQQ